MVASEAMPGNTQGEGGHGKNYEKSRDSGVSVTPWYICRGHKAGRAGATHPKGKKRTPLFSGLAGSEPPRTRTWNLEIKSLGDPAKGSQYRGLLCPIEIAVRG
jgi:hypothetical protein